ncbi:hypothetical protein Pcinc_011215 [Petrolisthes cinctipes]|uniref:Uncharacterized protein n=1 Tax=Petrolisthes cinctipes TaxID=88211 RepID=A0AAE1KUN6_PETCI|nr:hypothetical protein Pcinc_011215 [Petrolisthes cinctipes]
MSRAASEVNGGLDAADDDTCLFETWLSLCQRKTTNNNINNSNNKNIINSNNNTITNNNNSRSPAYIVTMTITHDYSTTIITIHTSHVAISTNTHHPCHHHPHSTNKAFLHI